MACTRDFPLKKLYFQLATWKRLGRGKRGETCSRLTAMQWAWLMTRANRLTAIQWAWLMTRANQTWGGIAWARNICRHVSGIQG